jgi:hypothetical protein
VLIVLSFMLLVGWGLQRFDLDWLLLALGGRGGILDGFDNALARLLMYFTCSVRRKVLG